MSLPFPADRWPFRPPRASLTNPCREQTANRPPLAFIPLAAWRTTLRPALEMYFVPSDRLQFVAQHRLSHDWVRGLTAAVSSCERSRDPPPELVAHGEEYLDGTRSSFARASPCRLTSDRWPILAEHPRSAEHSRFPQRDKRPPRDIPRIADVVSTSTGAFHSQQAAKRRAGGSSPSSWTPRRSPRG